MAVTYGFYNSLNGDRKYNAEDISHIFNGIITDGVFSTIGDALMTVAGTGMQVVVKTGKCWFNGTWTMNDSLLPLDIEAADVSLTRIDAVVVEVDTSVATRANNIKIVKGTASANPAKPSMKSEEFVHQYPIAYVTISAGATSITADKISINVGKDKCPFITSVLQQANITDIFNGWEAEFGTWFENVKNQLSGDVAANLQRQIDANTALIHQNEPNEATKTLLKLGANGTSNDAWQTLFLGIGKVVAMVEVLDYDGSPKSGVTITGGTALEGRTLVTDETGIAYCNCTDGAEIRIKINSTIIETKIFNSTGVITKITFRLHRLHLSITNGVNYVSQALSSVCVVNKSYNAIEGYICNPSDTDTLTLTSKVTGYADYGAATTVINVNKNSYNNVLSASFELQSMYAIVTSSKNLVFSPLASVIRLYLISPGAPGSGPYGGGGHGGAGGECITSTINNSDHTEKSITVVIGSGGGQNTTPGNTTVSGAISATARGGNGASGGSGMTINGIPATSGSSQSPITLLYNSATIEYGGGGGGGGGYDSNYGDGGNGGSPYGGDGGGYNRSGSTVYEKLAGRNATGIGGGGGGGARKSSDDGGSGGASGNGALVFEVKYS